jgi:hypothetical protein
MDGAWIGSVDIAIKKAFTACAFDIATKDLAAQAQPGGQLFGIHTSNDEKVMIFAGGISLQRDGKVIGAIGVSGGTVDQFHKPANFQRSPDSDLINECVLQDFGDALRIHHCFSREAFTKDKFEYALERVLNLCGTPATLASRGNPGHDITISGVRFSLKTQANKGISSHYLHVSKFMELGRGTWTDKEEDFIGLREQFFRHMNSYDRILSLRRLRGTRAYSWYYEN